MKWSVNDPNFVPLTTQSPSAPPRHHNTDCTSSSGQTEDHISLWAEPTPLLPPFLVVCVELLAAVQLAQPGPWLMAWVWDSEVLNCPYVNQPINAEQSHVTSAPISPSACGDVGRIWEHLEHCRGMMFSKRLSHKKRMKRIILKRRFSQKRLWWRHLWIH